MDRAVTAQLKKIAHTSNYYYAEPVVSLAEKLVNIAGMRRAFFCNSGAEANEGALKLARKYSYDKYGGGRSAVITLKDSFHGRTLAALTMTGQDAFHRYFHPFAEGVRYAPANDIGAMQELMGEDVCAVFIEPIQGEGGVHVLDTDYAKALEALCAKKDLLLACDEVQCGTGRTDGFSLMNTSGSSPTSSPSPRVSAEAFRSASSSAAKSAPASFHSETMVDFRRERRRLRGRMRSDRPDIERRLFSGCPQKRRLFGR
jgi:acetylornithine/N-succinyldiaminopimelate aminotransferase